jgi:2OG-Fe(II) oxygenase superfamily
LYGEPWQHLVAHDFLPADVLERSLEEVAAESYEYGIEYRGSGRIEFSLLRSETLWRAEDTPDFPTHHDHVEGGNTIASFLYLSPGWSGECGGRFNLYEAKEQGTPSSSIEPVQNRLLAFHTSPSHWHSVERVRGWERLSVLALWDIEPS